MALALTAHIEITVPISIRAFLTQCKRITDARLLNKITNGEIRRRTSISTQLQETGVKILRPH
jgi:hypothetical protein